MLYSYIKNFYTQWLPHSPALTEENLPSQAGKVFIVTGSSSGIGFELTNILYSKGATIYMACRSQEKTEKAIEIIRTNHPGMDSGRLEYIHLDLEDLRTVKAAAKTFAARESKLDVLWNNAGIGIVPAGSRTKQMLEKSVGVNCIAPLLFTQLLIPQLREATYSATKDSVRIIWTSSWLAESHAIKNDTVDFKELATGSEYPMDNYATSKAGNWMLALEGAKRYGCYGILSLAQNPGNVGTDIWSLEPTWLRVMHHPMLYKTIFGAYTELYAGLSEDITAADNGGYIIPWGRVQHNSHRKDLVQAMKDKRVGGFGLASEFWTWCEDQAKRNTSRI